MELRTLRYFMEICTEGSMSRAAEKLCITQPTLSRQMADLERELGCDLFIRHSRSVEPTEEGRYLMRRASEILALAQRTEDDLKRSSSLVEGDVSIASGDSAGFRIVASHIREFQRAYPHVRFHLHSGNAEYVISRLQRGLDDFAILMGYPNMERFEFLKLEHTNIWGVYVPEGHPISRYATVAPVDLEHVPLIGSEQSINTDELSNWFGASLREVNLVCTYTLPYLATYLVKEGVGCMLGYRDMFETGPGTGMAFVPFAPSMTTTLDLAWKRDQPLSNAARLFLENVLANRRGFVSSPGAVAYAGRSHAIGYRPDFDLRLYLSEDRENL